MTVATVFRKAKVRQLSEEGWFVYDEYPAAGITIMAREHESGAGGFQLQTIMKNGRVKPGSHPPKN